MNDEPPEKKGKQKEFFGALDACSITKLVSFFSISQQNVGPHPLLLVYILCFQVKQNDNDS